MDLTNNDAALIGALGEYPGYKLLRDYLQAGLDDLWTRVEAAEDDATERRLVSAWRERRRILAEMDEMTSEYLPYAEATIDAHELNVSNQAISSAELRRRLREMAEKSLDPGDYDIMNIEGEDSSDYGN